ncbi:hypothetical protein [uncultured Methylobacterium sp.]|uniref:hypothetical protein n=1 Tax=uncultured Methylobacterium sp. TaxID=157278 RepID=UPI0035CC9CD3
MSDPQLACLAVSLGAVFIGSLYALGDIAGRIVGGAATPADPIETLSVIAGHAGRFVAPLLAGVLTAAAFLFGWLVRP